MVSRDQFFGCILLLTNGIIIPIQYFQFAQQVVQTFELWITVVPIFYLDGSFVGQKKLDCVDPKYRKKFQKSFRSGDSFARLDLGKMRFGHMESIGAIFSGPVVAFTKLCDAAS